MLGKIGTFSDSVAKNRYKNGRIECKQKNEGTVLPCLDKHSSIEPCNFQISVGITLYKFVYYEL